MIIMKREVYMRRVLSVFLTMAVLVCTMTVASFADASESEYVSILYFNGISLQFHLEDGYKLCDYDGSISEYLEYGEIPGCHVWSNNGEFVELEYISGEFGGSGYLNADKLLQGGEQLLEVPRETCVVSGKPATCTENGIKDCYKCKDCQGCGLFYHDAKGLYQIGNETQWQAWLRTDSEEGGAILAALGHKWNNGETMKDGSIVFTCERCGETRTEKASIVEKTVATGDAENVAMWVAIMLGTMVVTGAIVLQKK